MQLAEQAVQVAAAYEQQRHLNDLKDQFLLNVNHELRTPLTEINGYLNLLTEYREQIDEETQITFLQHAVHGCEELLHLVNNVLEAIRGDFHEKATLLEPLSMDRVVHEVLDLFEPKKRQQYVLKLDIAEDSAVYADRQYLRRVLLNLLSNAFKYSPPQSQISISAQLLDTPSGESSADLQEYASVCRIQATAFPPRRYLCSLASLYALNETWSGTCAEQDWGCISANKWWKPWTGASG